MKEPIKCIINNQAVETLAPVGTVTLDFIRQHQKLPGTKEGCREGECGACTILMGELQGSNMQYKAVASCLLPLGEVNGKHIVTVEGINGSTLTPIQQALVDEGASQCGFCTPGIVMSLTGFFLFSETLDYQDAVDALDGNICRCTGYVSIQRAVRQLCDSFAPHPGKRKNRVEQLVQWGILPDYFLHIPEQLKNLKTHPHPSPEETERVIVAGATDLYVQQPEELLGKKLEFISQRKGLTGILRKDNTVYIGAGTTMEAMKHSPLINQLFPNMKAYLNRVSSTIMRNRATLAGNIANASPIGDLTIILLALQADLCLVKGTEKRELPLKKFFKGYKTLDMKKGEIIETIKFPVPDVGSRFHFEKVSQRKYLDIASCNTAISITTDENSIKDIHLSAGGVAPIPLFLEKTCAFLKGKEISGKIPGEAVKVMEQEISPISDVRGSAGYKTLLLRNLIFAHFLTLFPDKNVATDEHG
jgi:xanthine dehydrogenase small subunit